jgi:hypothetical protein
MPGEVGGGSSGKPGGLSHREVACVLISRKGACLPMKSRSKRVRGLPVSIGVATLAALAVAGCAGPLSPTPVLSPHPIAAAPDRTPYLVANAPEQAILRIDVEGIFAVSDGLPALALYGDGLVLKDPNTTACYGGRPRRARRFRLVGKERTVGTQGAAGDTRGHPLYGRLVKAC